MPGKSATAAQPHLERQLSLVSEAYACLNLASSNDINSTIRYNNEAGSNRQSWRSGQKKKAQPAEAAPTERLAKLQSKGSTWHSAVQSGAGPEIVPGIHRETNETPVEQNVRRLKRSTERPWCLPREAAMPSTAARPPRALLRAGRRARNSNCPTPSPGAVAVGTRFAVFLNGGLVP